MRLLAPVPSTRRPARLVLLFAGLSLYGVSDAMLVLAGLGLDPQRAGVGVDAVEGDVTREFVATTVGSENLHIQPNILGSLVSNRGTRLTGLTTDIDLDPRGASSVAGRFDIGMDEFTGQIRNFDVMAEDVIGPVGYRASTGRFSDAEYVMGDSAIVLRTQVRNACMRSISCSAVSPCSERTCIWRSLLRALCT